MLLAGITVGDFFNPLVLFGFAGQFVFMLRFLVQWFASERRGRSYVPIVFWYFSCLGGVMLFAYATMKEDVVFMAGQALGLTIYVRNLVLIHRRRALLRRRRRGPAVVPGLNSEPALKGALENAAPTRPAEN